MEKPNDLFQDLSQEERLEALKAQACKQDSQPIRRFYSHDERQQMKDSVYEDTSDLLKKKEEFSIIKKEFDKAAKERNEQIKSAVKDLDKGYTENEEPVFLIDDQENSVMHIYDQFGKHQSTRRLYPEERQTTILNMEQKAS